MEDISQGLLEILQKAFEGNLSNDSRVTELLELIKAGKGSYADAGDYADCIGRALSQAFVNHVSAGTLPDGKMYWNIADRVLRPLLESDYALAAEAARMVQGALNEKAGLGLKAVAADMPKGRVEAILNMVASGKYEDKSWILGEQLQSFCRKAVDDTLKANLDFQSKAGLAPKVIRKTTNQKPCKTCVRLAGTYEYPDDTWDLEPSVFWRHNSCRCVVEYDPGDRKGKKQNVHTKRWTSPEERDILKKRKTVGYSKNKTQNIRGMANGPRRGALTRVSEQEECQIRTWADELGIPQGVLRFNAGSKTGFVDELVKINVRGDVFPSEFAQNPDSILNARCALAHEYYGHMKSHPSQFAIGDWRDEFRASYRAALDTPNLTNIERSMLMIDAFDRAREAGITVRLNLIARRIIYEIGR